MEAIDYRLALGYGSAWHLLRCLGWHRNKFNADIAAKLGATKIMWFDFIPAKETKYYPCGAPIRDSEWKRIDFIMDEELRGAYPWPQRGEQQNWDAVGKAVIKGREEWLLVEAKSHLGEIQSHGTSASEAGGRPIIREIFKHTLQVLGHSKESSLKYAEEWLCGHYQHANRLATLQFLEERGIGAHLVFVYFCGDRHPSDRQCPQTSKEWESKLNVIDQKLGLMGTSKLEKRIHRVFIDLDFKEATQLDASKQDERSAKP